MPDVPYIIRTRNQKALKHRQNPWGKIALGCSLLISLMISLAGMLSGLIYIELTRDLPSPDAIVALIESPDGLLYQPTRLYDRSGEHVLYSLENPAARDRDVLNLDTSQANYFPASLITATLAVSDPGFWQHPGFRLDSLNLNESSTLAQQLVSDLLLWDEPQGIRRALRERLLAAQITSRYGRERVLSWYLNTANYGRLAFGADAAARVYFGKPAAELTLAEASLLAAVSETPALNPLDAPGAAQDRQREALEIMVNQGVVTQDQAAELGRQDLAFQASVPAQQNLAPAFANLVLEQLTNQIDLARLERGGYKITTTLDYALQLQATCAAATLKARQAGETNPPQAADGSECQSARLLPTIPQGSQTTPENSAVNIIISDPEKGEILALVGDVEAGKDPAHKPGHPAGTILTPFSYLTAFSRGLSPATLVWDIPSQDQETDRDAEYHGPMRMRTALANDYLLPLNQVINQVGLENVWKTVQQLGLASGEVAPETGGELLNSTPLTLLELSQAYGIFANQGILTGLQAEPENGSNGASQIEPVTVLDVEDTLAHLRPDQITLAGGGRQSQRPVINPQLAFLMNDVLSDETARWPSLGHPNMLEIGRPVAAKIGETPNGNDAWTVGYTPERLVAVWAGRDANGSTTSNLAQQSAALWHAVMQYSLKDLPYQDWTVPAGISRLNVCNPSGLLPSADCLDVVSEVFLAGTEPTQPDSLYRSFQINRETGRLATAFTPPDLIGERVYMILPPEAEAWARLAGLPTPPEEYDVIQTPAGQITGTQITSPAMLANISGKIDLVGSAYGEDFAYYRLQAGKGLNPRTWLQIGEDATQPVEQGLLGVWDTQGLDGLHTVQLQVVRNDQRVTNAVIQVTVDNQPPEIAILSPSAGQEVNPRSGQITFLVDAQDNLGIQQVDFYLDGKLLDSRFQSPYAIPWQSKSGKHILRAVATDRAGNQSEATREFTVAP